MAMGGLWLKIGWLHADVPVFGPPQISPLSLREQGVMDYYNWLPAQNSNLRNGKNVIGR